MGVLKVRNSSNTAWLEVGGTVGLENLGTITDADGDTLVQCEKTPGENMIRMDAGGNEVLTLTEDGNMQLPLGSGCYVHSVAAQVIPTGSSRKITMNQEHFDHGNDFDTVTNYRFTAPEYGRYVITLSLLYGPTGAFAGLDYHQCQIHLNGSPINYGRMNPNYTGAHYPQVKLSVTIELDENDYIEFFAHQTSGANQTVYGDTFTYGSIIKVQ
jgi:hypothetical protein